MRQDFIHCLNPHGFHRIAYTEWGARDGARRTAICAHALTRNGRDFDFLAQALADTHHLFCPDTVGRGRSDNLPDAALYGYPQYCADMATLIARTGATDIDWIGTSMGGLTGMMLAAQPNSPIRRLVVNDIGPFLPKVALQRLATYVGKAPLFKDQVSLEQYLRQVLSPWGAIPNEGWRHIATHGSRPGPDGQLSIGYDPAIGQAFAGGVPHDIDLWPIWDRITCPVLLLRGAESDLLTVDCAREMQRRGPRVTFVEWPGIGHAPSLMQASQIAVIKDWLRQTNA